MTQAGTMSMTCQVKSITAAQQKVRDKFKKHTEYSTKFRLY